MARRRKGSRSKRVNGEIVFEGDGWFVLEGVLRPTAKCAARDHLFKYVAEKLPWDSLNDVSNYLKRLGVKRQGIYMAHDSFGVARYGGRGNIFSRLRSHKQKYRRELVYYSFFIIENKTHEREIENNILRAAGPQMVLNPAQGPRRDRPGQRRRLRAKYEVLPQKVREWHQARGQVSPGAGLEAAEDSVQRNATN